MRNEEDREGVVRESQEEESDGVRLREESVCARVRLRCCLAALLLSPKPRLLPRGHKEDRTEEQKEDVGRRPRNCLRPNYAFQTRNKRTLQDCHCHVLAKAKGVTPERGGRLIQIVPVTFVTIGHIKFFPLQM